MTVMVPDLLEAKDEHRAEAIVVESLHDILSLLKP